MERGALNRDPTINMQKKLVESRRSRWSMPEPESKPVPEPVPDITALMNDWFYGSGSKEQKSPNLNSERTVEDDRSGDSSKLTHEEWLQEAKRMVAASPSRSNSPSRLGGSPRFAAAQQSEFVPQSALDRRDPLSRSARRHRAIEGFSGEILSKSVKHSRNKSSSFEQTVEKSPAASVQQWLTNILKPNNGAEPKYEQNSQVPDDLDINQMAKQLSRRKSRFHDDPSAAQATIPQPISRRTFKTQPGLENPVLSPPKHLIESAHRRSISSSTCSIDKFSKLEADAVQPGQLVAELRLMEEVGSLNLFLKEQRAVLTRISRGEIPAKAKIILSGSSNSTSSMVAAISYAWLLENKEKKEEEGEIMVPVMNIKRRRMWNQRQAAWLLHHVGIDVKSLLFSDEVDLESLLMARQLNVLVVGQDILKTNGEVGSLCTLLTDNFCEEAYDLLEETPSLRKLLLAGILLDTHNLNFAAKLPTNRDAEAVQLLLVGFPPTLRFELSDQLMRDQKDESFLDVLRANYGKPPRTRCEENGEFTEQRVSVRISTSNPNYQQLNRITSGKGSSCGDATNSGKTIEPCVPSPSPSSKNTAEPPARPKNSFFLAKWFGFGSK
ncbi:hypothetical protein H6P81_012713 [Aristolochia fimbriata]|uniref:Uncharacterized protein n=1 Tax=Aristolochia fimbriata TaxID=158543 RepID=A0AAV7ECL3_ARIFI|nr:hypothetical protein H6P81_012713 [Aristolochia fimbriata]